MRRVRETALSPSLGNGSYGTEESILCVASLTQSLLQELFTEPLLRA